MFSVKIIGSSVCDDLGFIYVSSFDGVVIWVVFLCSRWGGLGVDCFFRCFAVYTWCSEVNPRKCSISLSVVNCWAVAIC